MQSQNKERGSIFFLLTTAFQIRSYLCTPTFHSLMRLKDELGLDMVFMSSTDSIKPFLEKHGCYYEPLVPLSESWRERKAYELRERLIHRMAAYRFNSIHGFAKLRRKQRITPEIWRKYRKFVRRKDKVHGYFGFPFPRSRSLLNRTLDFNYSSLMASNKRVESYFDKYNPRLVVFGTTQSPYVTSYVRYARSRDVPMIGGVGSWDNPTMDGPTAKGAKEYWVWNQIMLDEMVAYHDVAPEDIAITGVPQFDLYASLDAEAAKTEIRSQLNIPENSQILTLAAYPIRLGAGEPSIAEHVASNIEAGLYGDRHITLVVRSYPADTDFWQRFGHLEKYPFVRLYETPQVKSIEPDEYIKDMAFLGNLLASSDALLCGCGTVAIDAACLDTPVINLRFDGDVILPEPLRAKTHFEGDHYKKLLDTGGTRVVDSFGELDAAIRLYLAEPSIDADGRKTIRQDFAGWTDGRSASDKISERIRVALNVDQEPLQEAIRKDEAKRLVAK